MPPSRKRPSRLQEDSDDVIRANLAEEEEEDADTWTYTTRSTRSRAVAQDAPSGASPGKKRRLAKDLPHPQTDPKYRSIARTQSDGASFEDDLPLVRKQNAKVTSRVQRGDASSEDNVPLVRKKNAKATSRAQAGDASPKDSDDVPLVRKQNTKTQRTARAQEDESSRDERVERTENAKTPRLTQSEDADDYEEDADDQTSKKPQPSKAAGIKKRVTVKKVVSSVRDQTKGGKKTTPSLENLDEFNIPLDRRWKNTNKFVKMFTDGILAPPKSAPHSYKPPLAPASYICDLPKQDRNYVLSEDQVYLYDLTHVDGTVEKAWNLEVRNMNEISPKAVPIFQLLKKGEPTNNAVTEALCSDQNEVIRLGHIYADIMNRIPVHLGTKHWTEIGRGPNRMSKLRRFIDLASLLRWNQDLDFSVLHEEFISHPTGAETLGKACAYGTALTVEDKRKTSIATRTFAGYYMIDGEKEQSGVYISCILNNMDISTTGPQINTPVGYTFRNTYLGPNGPRKLGQHDSSDEKAKAAMRVVQYCHYKMAGMVGDKRQIQDEVDRIISEHVTKTKDRRVVGSYNGGRLFNLPSFGGNQVLIQFPRTILEWLGLSEQLRTKFCVRMATASRIAHSYAIHQLFIALRCGKSLLHAMQAMFVAADEVDLGIITTRQILETYCLCTSEERKSTEHPCMHCHKVCVCSTMLQDADNRTLCKNCAGKDAINDNRQTVKRFIQTSVTLAYHKDKKSGTNVPKWTVQSLVDQLLREHQVSDTIWKDGYDSEVTIHHARYSDVCQIGKTGTAKAIIHPYKPSLEKPYPCWLGSDRKLYLHHPENTTITLYCTNMGNTINSAAMIPWDKVALELTEQTQAMKPTSGHHVSTVRGWEAFERATDNIYAVSMRIPYTRRTRTKDDAAYAHPKQFRALVQQCKSGVWDGVSPVRPFTSRADSQLFFERFRAQLFTPWTRADIKQLIKHLEFLEASPRFNPHGLRFLRNSDGSPWLWRPDHRHPNADWDFMNREFQARFWTMDEWCDEENESPETPCTLFLFYAIQWLRTGGKCHFFGCTMTFAAGHACVYSIGRAVTVHGNDGTYIRDVVAGEAMRTGFSSPFPNNIDMQYDFAHCTIIIESWRSNSLRANFVGGQDLINLLKDSVRRRSLSTKWYDPPQEKDAYPELPRPGMYQSRLLREATYQRATDTSESDAEFESDMEFEQNEDTLDPFDNITVEERPESVDEKSAEHSTAQSHQGAMEDEYEHAMAEPEIHISPLTQTKIISRHTDDTRLKTSVDKDHPMAGFLVTAGKAPNDRPGYPTTDNTFCTYNGVQPLATFNNAGNVFDLEGNFLGNPLLEG